MTLKILQKINFEKTLIVLILSAYFIPNFYATDRIGNQWFFLSLVSLFALIYIYIHKNFLLLLKNIILSKAISFYFLFICWALISIFYSDNKVEALVTFNQYFTVFYCLIFTQILCLRLNNPKDFILNLLLVLLIFEIFLSIYPMLKDIENGSLVFRSRTYSGAAANVNITSFSLLYKTPILFYFIINSKKNILKIFYSFLFFLIVLIISVLGTRGAFLGIGICVLTFILYVLISKEGWKILIRNFSLILIALALAVLTNLKLSSDAKQTDILSRASTININTKDGSVNQRLRYYSHTIEQFKKNPIIGVGIGNWKLHSIDFDKKNINGYIIPYHAHNDFLQMLAELGFFGLLFYLLFLFYSTRILIYSKRFNNYLNIFLLGSLFIYLLDSTFNFPIARPISQLFLIALLILMSFHEKDYAP